MRFRAWIKKSDMSRQAVADRLGVTRSCINHWCTEIRIPRAENIKAIHKMTKGEVTEADFRRAQARRAA